MKSIVLIGIASLLLGSTAYAADLDVTVPEEASGPDLVGYFSVQGGAESILNDYSDGANFDALGDNASAAARIAFQSDPRFSVQGDLWYRYFYEQRFNVARTSWERQYPGAAVHLSWHPNSDANLVGLYGSFGETIYTPLHDNTDSPGTAQWATEGLEGALNVGNWRFYGQAGVIEELNAPAVHARVAFGVAQATYYLTPNFTVSGWAGVNGFVNSDSTSGGGRIGSRIEFKPDGWPVSFFATDQLRATRVSYSGGAPAGLTQTAIENTAMVGIRVPFGASTLQELDAADGLVDMNPNYGELPQ